VRRLGAMVGAEAKAQAYAASLEAHVDKVRAAAAALPRRPRVYFEEWDEPMISAIRWVSELVGVAGGDDIFPQRAIASLGRDRIVEGGDEVIAMAARSRDRLVVRQEVSNPRRCAGAPAGRRFRRCATASCTR
jgi:iron complex transport system substrate-binding protein